MQNRIFTCTPQKRVNHLNFSNKKAGNCEEALPKQLSPFADCLNTLHLTANTPLKMQLEFMQSPLPAKKDLFSQLLGTEQKMDSPILLPAVDNIEQESYDFEDLMIKESSDQEDSDNQSDSNDDGDQSGTKKRKRKSTAQIRMLKQELDGEMNWTKEKICKMAEITGLSQSQVYKWCWDQKKKTAKSSKDSYNRINRRKIIKKDYAGRQECMRYKHYSKQEIEELENHQQFTKPKIQTGIEESHQQTERKINKKLIFS